MDCCDEAALLADDEELLLDWKKPEAGCWDAAAAATAAAACNMAPLLDVVEEAAAAVAAVLVGMAEVVVAAADNIDDEDDDDLAFLSVITAIHRSLAFLTLGGMKKKLFNLSLVRSGVFGSQARTDDGWMDGWKSSVGAAAKTAADPPLCSPTKEEPN